MAAFARLIASGFGLGRAAWAPGTVASAAALAVGAALLAWHPVSLVIATALAAGGGWLAVRGAAVSGDPGWVVIDEVAGQWLAMLPLPTLPLRVPGWLGLLAAFALFRLLDIFKPGPIGWADRQVGAAGIMADDLIAGAIAAAVLLLIAILVPA